MSVLLPKSKEEFSKKGYWDSFFKTRGSKAFEWYGEYQELSKYLHKYVKEKEKILITGCGNSALGQNLYDVGYLDITNIDISQVVIRQMNQKVNNRNGLRYLQMDALNTTFDDQSFSAVLDKGTLDALMPNNEDDTLQLIIKYFEEIQRVTKYGGRYICISLLQDHILAILLDYFPKNNWMFRIVRCFEAEQAAVQNGERLIPVFIVICTKFKGLPNNILEVSLSSNEKLQRLDSINQVKSTIMSCQRATFVCASLQQKYITSENEISMDLYDPEDINPKYTVYVVDHVPQKKNSPYAVFIVPQGRESEWLFSTNAGRKELVASSNYNRLLIVTMHRNQKFGDLQDIQNELSDIIRDLTPPNMKEHKIPCLSLGTEGVGKRTIVHEGISEISGGYVVEDVEVEAQKFRRLFFLSNQLVVQSEAKLKNYKNRKGFVKEVVDVTYLTCQHHLPMIMGAYIACERRNNSSIAVVGVGGGGLCSFLNKFIPQTKIIGVEIDPEMVNIAKDFFGLQKHDKFEIQVNDGLKYLEQLANQDRKLDAILFDVDSKDTSIGMSCPPKEFLEDGIIDIIKKIIGKEGLFILNLVLRDESLRPPIADKLLKKFSGIATYKMEQELNEIFICGNQCSTVFKKSLAKAATELNNFLKKHNNASWVADLDLFNIVTIVDS